MKRSSLVLCLTIGVFGCKDEPSKPGPSAASGAVSASATGSLRVVEEAPIEVSEDGNLTRRVAVADLEEPVALSSLVKSAPDEWVWLQVKSADGRAMTIADVTETYDDHDIRLYLDAERRPSVGVFRRIPSHASPAVRRKLAQPRPFVVGATSLELRTVPMPTAERERRSVVVSRGGREVTLKPAQLEALKRVHARGGGRRKAGWRLEDVVKASGLGLGDVVLIDAEGKRAPVTASQLADDAVVALLRYNRRGLLRFSLYDAGPKPIAQLRDVRRIEALGPAGVAR